MLLLEKEVKPGITTAELDKIAEEFITKHGAKPSFKGYMVFLLHYVFQLMSK